MTIIKRLDGQPFALQPYRELLKAKPRVLMQQELSLLAKNNGEFVRLFTQKNGDIEAVFAHEAGYLLGENIWAACNKPFNMLYCEQLTDSSILWVVVRAGNIFNDSLLKPQDIATEYANIVASDVKYDVFVVRGAPLSPKATAPAVQLQAATIGRFELLEQSVFENMAVDKDLYLSPLNQELASRHFGKSSDSKIKVFVIILCLFFVIFAYKFFSQAPESQAQTTNNTALAVQQFLQTADAGSRLLTVSHYIAVSYGFNLWLPSQISYQANRLQVDLLNKGGDYQALQRLAKQAGARVLVNNEKAQLTWTITTHLNARQSQLPSQTQMISTLNTRINAVFIDARINFQQTHYLNELAQQDVRLNVVNISPQVLTIFAKNIQGLPMQLQGLRLTVQQGLLSGELRFTIMGKNT